VIDWSAVEINDEHEAALRAYLLEGPEAWLPIQDKLTDAQSAAPYVQLVQAALGVALRRRFSPTYDIDQIIQFVADVRLSLMESGVTIDPRIAENLVRVSLGDSDRLEVAPDDVQRLQEATDATVAMLFFLVAEAQPDEAWLDEFVREAGHLARRWTAESRFDEATG